METLSLALAGIGIVVALGGVAAAAGAVFCVRQAGKYHMLALHFGRLLNETEGGATVPEES